MKKKKKCDRIICDVMKQIESEDANADPIKIQQNKADNFL